MTLEMTKRYTHIFLDADVLIESKGFDEWPAGMFGDVQLVIAWHTVSELDKQKTRQGYRGERCRELLKLLKSEGPIILSSQTGLTAIMPDRPITRREFSVYPLDEDEADDWLIAEAEKFRQTDSNNRKVAILTRDTTTLVKILRMSSLRYLEGVELPDQILRGDAKREAAKSRSAEEVRLRRAASEFIEAIKGILS